MKKLMTNNRILVTAFCPYHIGHFTIVGFTLKSLISGAHFEGMLTTLCGYCVIGLSLVVLHSLTTFFKWKRPSRVIGLCYVVVKVRNSKKEFSNNSISQFQKFDFPGCFVTGNGSSSISSYLWLVVGHLLSGSI